MAKKLSVIIPCYNSDKTLNEAVLSCYEQGLSRSDFEIVIVDDASKDKTGHEMEKLSQRYDNITLIHHEKNLGGGAARNTGANNATSDVLFFLDSDDILPPYTLNKMYEYLKVHNIDGVGLHHSTKFIGTDVNNIHHTDTFGYVDTIIPFEALLQYNDVYCPLYSVFMLTKESFVRSGGYPTHHGFDTQGFAWRFLAAGNKAMTCPETNYLHRILMHESYYLREFNQGKVNFNWQMVFLEHEELLEPSTIKFIKEFNCRNFTLDISTELKKKEKIFVNNYKDLLGKVSIHNTEYLTKSIATVHRNSLLGLLYRIQSRLKI